MARSLSDFALSRRDILKLGAAGIVASEAAAIADLAFIPNRLALAAPRTLPDIQYDIGNFIAPALQPIATTPSNALAGVKNSVVLRFGPVFTFFVPATLSRTPTLNDQAVLADALNTIEDAFPFSPQGVFTHIGYGTSYFKRLTSSVVTAHMPTVVNDSRAVINPADVGKPVLEDAVPSPVDIPRSGDALTLYGATNQRFSAPVTIEHNDMVFVLRSDRMRNLLSVMAWLQGSDELGRRRVQSPRFNGLIQFQTTRVMFQNLGLPRKVAERNNLPFAPYINPQSPMWMSYADQQTDAASSALGVTFQGDPAIATVTSAKAGDYFDNGSLMHLSDVTLDLEQFYRVPTAADIAAGDTGEPYTERYQYAFRSNVVGTQHGLRSEGNPFPSSVTNGVLGFNVTAANLQQFIQAQFVDSGGPFAAINDFQGNDDALKQAQTPSATAAGLFTPNNQSQSATFTGKARVGHEAALQRSGRTAKGQPLHIRIDGTGFDGRNVPGGAKTPKLEFAAFFPSSSFFARMRANTSAIDLVTQFGIDTDDNGFERFLNATSRQNFLIPPRRNRAFPLLELDPAASRGGGGGGSAGGGTASGGRGNGGGGGHH